MEFQSIEWLRNEMRNVTKFECRCGKTFSDFDSWWNHGIIKKHLFLTNEDVNNFMERLQ